MKQKRDVLIAAAKNIGRTAKMALKNGLIVDVQIVEAKVSYGIVRYTVTPLAGSGQAVIRIENLDIAPL